MFGDSSPDSDAPPPAAAAAASAVAAAPGSGNRRACRRWLAASSSTLTSKCSLFFLVLVSPLPFQFLLMTKPASASAFVVLGPSSHRAAPSRRGGLRPPPSPVPSAPPSSTFAAASSTTTSRLLLTRARRAKREGSGEGKREEGEEVWEKNYDDGVEGAGTALLAMSLLLSAWLFTVPPEFRRAYLCPAELFVLDVPVEERRECTPLSQWFADVFDYYRQGGGIQWDFTVDPRTVADNREFVDAVVKATTAGGGGGGVE